MRSIMLALTAAFLFTGAIATLTTVTAARADSTKIIKHDDGDKTVIKKNDNDDADKKLIIKKHEE